MMKLNVWLGLGPVGSKRAAESVDPSAAGLRGGAEIVTIGWSRTDAPAQGR